MSAIRLMKEFNMTPANLAHALINQFKLDTEVVTECMSNYYLRYWDSDYFFSQMKDGILEDQGKTYIVVYHKCTPENLRKSKQVILSFRNAVSDFNLPSYVLVNRVNFQ